MTHTAQVRVSLAKIPPHRWRYKIGKLVIAALLAALFYFVALPQHWSMPVDLAIVGAIGFCISEDVMAAIVKFIVAALRDLVATLPKGTTSVAPPPSGPIGPPASLPSGKAYGNDQPPG